MTFLSLFAGIGGIDLGLERAGMKCIGQVEIDPYCRRVLAKHWPDVPRFDDICTFHGGMLNEKPDLICGGFPCQDISYAGRGAGIEGERSGLWSEFHRLICDIQPSFVIVENVAALLDRGMGTVLGDLAASGFDAEWSVFPACALGAPHSRERVFLFAHSHEIGYRARLHTDEPPPRCGHWKATEGKSEWSDVELWLRSAFQAGDGFPPESSPARVHDGVPAELDDDTDAECDALGNAVVPQVAEFIGRRIMQSVLSFPAPPPTPVAVQAEMWGEK
jgi:DNA (cytosine-5)-methyltransferase 1